MVLPFLTLYLTSRLGFTTRAAVGYVAWYGIGSILGSLLGGRLIGRIGALRLMMVSFAFSGLALLLLPMFHDPWWLGGAVMVLSVVAEMSRPASATAATSLCPERDHARALALNRVAVNLGMTCGPAAAGFLTQFGYHWLFVVDGITCWLAAAVLAWRFGRAADTGESSIPESATGLGSTRNPWRDPAFLGLALITSLQGIVFFQLISTYPMYLKDWYHFGEPEIGLVFALNTCCVVLFEMALIGRIAGYSQWHTIAWGNFLILLGFGLLPLGNGWPMASLSVLVWTLGEMLSMPVAAAYVSRLARNGKERGRYFGAYTSCFSVAFVLAPLIGGAAYTWNPQALWWTSLAFAPLLLWGMLARRQPGWGDPPPEVGLQPIEVGAAPPRQGTRSGTISFTAPRSRGEDR